MKIYNTLKREKEDFTPVKKGRVGMYVCGPTVYDEPHIGHARSAYIFDVIRRYVAYKGFKVTFVRNVTDVDDKIIDKAKKELGNQKVAAKMNEKVSEISEKYLAAYHESMASLGIAKPDKEPKATEYIKKMVKFIEVLIKNGNAYESDGDVYFDIRKARDYGKLSNQNMEKMEAGARISPGEKKKNPLDFALWKKAKEGEPSWPSPWGKGRPGWHIECSVMSSDILGPSFDIHGGGIDLVFPHHENEIAQSEGAGKKFARYWMHNGLLTINGEKMAKSLGNFITIRDFLAKHGDPDLLKMLFVGSHYRHPVDYTEEKIEQIKSAKESILIFLQKADDLLKKRTEKAAQKAYKNYVTPFETSMDDDFNTPLAISVIFRCKDDGNKILEKKTLEKKDYKDLVACRQFIKKTADIFAVKFKYGEIKDTAILAKIKAREDARKGRDFKKADEIRNELLKQGVILEDTKEGTTWRKKL